MLKIFRKDSLTPQTERIYKVPLFHRLGSCLIPLFDISSEQLACVNGAEPGMGLIRFGDKIVPLDNTIEKDNNLYQLFNTNFHEMVLDEKST